MSCLLLTPSGDIDCTNGQTTTVTDPVQAGAIKLKGRLQLFLGTWFRDTRVGVPYFTKILVKNPNIPLIQNILRSIIVQTPPFINATVTVTPPNGARMANASFVAYVDPAIYPGANGTPITVTAAALDAPFIVNVPSAAATNGGAS